MTKFSEAAQKRHNKEKFKKYNSWINWLAKLAVLVTIIIAGRMFLVRNNINFWEIISGGGFEMIDKQ